MLWRVLLAVLGFFGGVGILIYLIGWLAIPSEGDTASPIESLLGRGRSGMTPVSVVLLGLAAVVTFGFIVHDGFRATVLAAAVITGAVLLLRRSGWTANNRDGGTGESRTANNPPSGTWYPPFGGSPVPPGGTTATGPGTAYAASTPAGSPAPAASPAPATEPAAGSPAGAGEPPTAPLPPTPPGYTAPAGPGYTPAGFAPPPGGYRPPFAPHGPWASGQSGYRDTAVQAPPPKQPKPPRERSKLGRITFFTLLFVLGMMALAHAAGATVPVSAYFAAALAVTALGLVVGAWFGRARGLIFLAVVATAGLLISSGAERWGPNVGDNVYRPQVFAGVADKYEFEVGKTTLDLRAVDFTDQQKNVTISAKFGEVQVLLPDKVDTTATVDLRGPGRAMLFGRESNGSDVRTQQVTDLGADGAGGGTLNLTIDMNAGNVEVIR